MRSPGLAALIDQEPRTDSYSWDVTKQTSINYVLIIIDNAFLCHVTLKKIKIRLSKSRSRVFHLRLIRLMVCSHLDLWYLYLPYCKCICIILQCHTTRGCHSMSYYQSEKLCINQNKLKRHIKHEKTHTNKCIVLFCFFYYGCKSENHENLYF